MEKHHAEGAEELMRRGGIWASPPRLSLLLRFSPRETIFPSVNTEIREPVWAPSPLGSLSERPSSLVVHGSQGFGGPGAGAD